MPNFDFSRISTIQWVFVGIFGGLFLIASIIHLWFCYHEKERERKISKCPCVTLLALSCVAFAPTEWLVYCGLLAGVLGDLFLIWKNNKKLLAIGAGFFFLGHVFYIVRLIMFSLRNMGDDAWAYFAAWIVAMIIFICAFYGLARRIVGNGKLATALIFYLSILGSLTIWSVIGCALGHFDFLFISVLGGLTFLASDTILGITMFKKDIKRRDFFIMATYLLAQLLVSAGMLLTTCAA